MYIILYYVFILYICIVYNIRDYVFILYIYNIIIGLQVLELSKFNETELG